jgi:hypothetical protein
MKKLFIVLTLLSLLNLTAIKAEEPEDAVTTYEVTDETPFLGEEVPVDNTTDEETPFLGEEVPVDNTTDEDQLEEKVFATSEELDEELLTAMNKSNQDYNIYYVAIGGVVVLMVGVWLFILNKARHMAKN